MLKNLSKPNLIKILTSRYAFPSIDVDFFSSKINEVRSDAVKDVRITLISGNNDVQILNLSQAQIMSKARNMKLIKITDLDVKTRRPLYKLMSTADYLEEQLKMRAEKKAARNEWTVKGQKVLQLNSKIAEHDLEIRCKNLVKWLKKNHEVRILIKGDESNPDSMEKAFSKITKEIVDIGKVQQKNISGAVIKCVLVPIQPKVENTEASSSESKNVEPSPPETEKVAETEDNAYKTTSNPFNSLGHQQKREIHTNSNNVKNL